MQQFYVIAIDHNSVVTADNPAVYSEARLNDLHPPETSLDISNPRSPRMLFIDFHVVEILVQPTQDIVVRQPISQPPRVHFPRDGTLRRLLEAGGVDRGRTW